MDGRLKHTSSQANCDTSLEDESYYLLSSASWWMRFQEVTCDELRCACLVVGGARWSGYCVSLTNPDRVCLFCVGVFPSACRLREDCPCRPPSPLSLSPTSLPAGCPGLACRSFVPPLLTPSFFLPLCCWDDPACGSTPQYTRRLGEAPCFSPVKPRGGQLKNAPSKEEYAHLR